jgi:hypothetical protein
VDEAVGDGGRCGGAGRSCPAKPTVEGFEHSSAPCRFQVPLSSVDGDLFGSMGRGRVDAVEL